MKDGIMSGNGDSRYLKSSIPETATLADIIAMLRAGTFPVDLSGINADGWTQLGTALNKNNLLKDATADSLGLDSAQDPVPDEVFQKLKTKHDIIAQAGKLIISTRNLETEYPGSFITLDGRTLTEDGVDAYKDTFPIVTWKSRTAINTTGTGSEENGSASYICEYRGALFFINTNYGYIAYSGDHGETWARTLSGSVGYNPRDVIPCGDYIAVTNGINYSDSTDYMRAYIYSLPEGGSLTYVGNTGYATGSYSGTTIGTFPETSCVLVESGNYIVLYNLANQTSAPVSDTKSYTIVRYVDGAYAGIREDGLICGTAPTSFTVVESAYTPLIMTVGSDYSDVGASIVAVTTAEGYVLVSTDKGASYTAVMVDANNTSAIRFFDKLGDYWYCCHTEYSGLYRCLAGASGEPSGSWSRVTVDNEDVLIGETVSSTRSYKKARLFDGYRLIPIIASSGFYYIRMNAETGSFSVLETELTVTQAAYPCAYIDGTNCVVFVSGSSFLALNILTGRVKASSPSYQMTTTAATISDNLARQIEERGEVIFTVDPLAEPCFFVRDAGSLYMAAYVYLKNCLPVISIDVTSNIACDTYYCFNAE